MISQLYQKAGNWKRAARNKQNSYWGTICTPLEVTAKDGNARKALERESGENVVTSDNYLPQEKKKGIKP